MSGDTKAELERLRELAEWLVSLDLGTSRSRKARAQVKLSTIVTRARAALLGEDPPDDGEAAG